MTTYKRITTTSKTPDIIKGRDLFQTPNWAVDILIPFISNYGVIWECAAGRGKIANRLVYHGFSVVRSDIMEYEGNMKKSFLDFDCLPNNVSLIVTNPPFSIKEKFVDKCVQLNVPFALLVNADYNKTSIKWIEEYGCARIVPTSRINYVTPNVVNRVNVGEGTLYTDDLEIPSNLLYKYSSAQFHSMWLTRGLGIYGEKFIDVPIRVRKENM